MTNNELRKTPSSCPGKICHQCFNCEHFTRFPDPDYSDRIILRCRILGIEAEDYLDPDTLYPRAA